MRSRKSRSQLAAICSRSVRGAGETIFWLPEHRALIPGDRILGAPGGGVRLCPESWLRYLSSNITRAELWTRLWPPFWISPWSACCVPTATPSFETAARRSTTPSLLARRRGTFANTGPGCAARPSTRACLGSYWRNPLEGRKVWREESDDKDVRPRSRAYRRARNDNTGRCRDLHPSYNDHRAPRRRLAAYWGRSSYAALRTAVRADALCPVWDVSGACTSGCAAQAGAVRVPRIHTRCDRRIHADPTVRDPTGASFASGLLQGLRLVRAVRRLAHRRRERFLRTDASRPPVEITPARLPGSAVAASPSLRVAAMNGHPKNRSVERHSRTLAQAV